MLRVKNLTAGYKELKVIFDINAKILPKKITAIVGPNGSGKSTLLKATFGLATVHSGKVIYEGRDITGLPPHERTKIGMAYLPQVENVFTNLSVEENLKIAGYILDDSELKDRMDLAFSVFPELKKRTKQKVGTLSGGERQFLAIATALIRKSKLLMLDEPTAQLAPKLAEVMFKKIVELRDKLDLTIVLVEQNIKKALEISDKAYLLTSGRIAFGGDSEELLSHEKFEQLCLGLT